MKRDMIAVLIGVIIALCAQIIIAPNVAISSAMPNFLLMYALVVAIVRPNGNTAIILGFILGLLYDLVGHGPVGAMAFLVVLACFIISRLFTYLNNESRFMPLTALFVALVVVEVLYAVFLIISGTSIDVVPAIIYRALPCALYDCVFGLLVYLLAERFLVASQKPASSQAKSAASAGVVQVSAQSQVRGRKTKKKMPRF